MWEPLAVNNVSYVLLVESEGRSGTTKTSAPVFIRKRNPDILSATKSQQEELVPLVAVEIKKRLY